MAFIAELKNVMLVKATPIKNGEFKLYTFVEMDKFNKVTILGQGDLPDFQDKQMVDVRFSVSQKEVPVTRADGSKSTATETRAFVIGLQPHAN